MGAHSDSGHMLAPEGDQELGQGKAGHMLQYWLEENGVRTDFMGCTPGLSPCSEEPPFPFHTGDPSSCGQSQVEIGLFLGKGE